MMTSGVGHLAADSECETLELCREILSYFPFNNIENPPFISPVDEPLRMDEVLNPIILLDILEIQLEWAQNAIIGLAWMGGHSIGIIAQEPSNLAGVDSVSGKHVITGYCYVIDCDYLHYRT
jgi:acetyl-CoA carboxylase carboxyltransferase component